jgi:protein involved in polysaccharide export with SLBB domain
MLNTFDPLPGSEPEDNPPSPKKSDAKKASVTSRRAWTLFFVGVVLVVGVAVVVSQYVEKPVATVASTNQNSRTPAKVTPTPDGVVKVYITGEIANPGVYSVQPGDRVIDVVNIAGGFTGNADQRRVEQAARVKDEMRIDIPKLPATADPAAPAPAQNQQVALPPANISTPSATNPPLPNVNNSGKINVKVS